MQFSLNQIKAGYMLKDAYMMYLLIIINLMRCCFCFQVHDSRSLRAVVKEISNKRPKLTGEVAVAS